MSPVNLRLGVSLNSEQIIYSNSENIIKHESILFRYPSTFYFPYLFKDGACLLKYVKPLINYFVRMNPGKFMIFMSLKFLSSNFLHFILLA
jgi:hypothetical protein